MRKPGTDESNVQMSDVLCDFCHAEWTEDLPMIEGHEGSCICGRCLTAAYTHMVLRGQSTAGNAFSCRMCLERPQDRAALNRSEEPGWVGMADALAAVCRRCVKQAAGALHKDKDINWRKPTL